jgi:hypothetical protein
MANSPDRVESTRPKIKFKRKPPFPVNRGNPALTKKEKEVRAVQRRKAQRPAREIAKTEKRYDISVEIVNEAIIAERGLITGVAKRLEMSRTSLLRYIEKHPVCLETLGHARDEMGDKAENKLFEAIEKGDVRCLLYYLSTVHRHRGYGLNNSDIPATLDQRGPVYVETVNIVGVPSGTFLPPESIKPDNMVIESTPAD